MNVAQVWSIALQLFGSGCLIVVIRVAVSLRDSVRDLVLEVRELQKHGADHETRLRDLEFGRRSYDKASIPASAQ